MGSIRNLCRIYWKHDHCININNFLSQRFFKINLAIKGLKKLLRFSLPLVTGGSVGFFKLIY